jgi:nicotinate-nucleotide adenylyltransferase
MMRLGVMGGTFDPIHHGHLYCAENARECCGLNRVLFIPAGRSPFKPAGDQTEAEHRLAMVKVAIADNPYFAASRIELDRDGPSYTVDTLTALNREYGQSDDPAELCLIVGADALVTLGSWHRASEILRLAAIAAVPRPGTDIAALRAAAAELEEQYGARITLCDGPAVDISATELRRRLAAGRSIRYLVPAAVAGYIADHGLYAGPGGAR